MSDTRDGRWEFDENGNVHYVPPEDLRASGGEHTGNTGSYNDHYSYTYSKPGKAGAGKQRSSSQKADTSWHWILIILGFVFWWPVGLVALFLELSGKWPGSRQTKKAAKRAAKAAQTAAQDLKRGYQTGRAQGSAREQQVRQQAEQVRARFRDQETASPKKSKKRNSADEGAPYGLGHVRLFHTIGGILAGLFGFAFVMELIDDLTYFVGWDYALSETLPLLALCLTGLTLFGVGSIRKRKYNRFEKYLRMVGNRETTSIAALASSMGVSEKKAEKDLEEMLERDFWPMGYVDAARQMLILGGPLEEPVPQPEPEPQAGDETAAEQTLRRIRQVKATISNQELTAKIDQIEKLTAKIFRLLEEKPEKASELRSFMNYYLPQTLKILESYAKLEAQGVEGDNIAVAKQKIESMMDKLVEGYEAQLDRLFADDVLDISADLKVMETMLEKDGLTADNELKF